jgi:hypothetical protein
VFAGGLATTRANDAQAAPVPHEFTVTASDLSYILDQIHVAERHFVSATPQHPCAGILGTAADELPSSASGVGLRTVDGSCNNLQPGGELFGAADAGFPRLTQAEFGPAEASPPDFFGPGSETTASSSYAQSSGPVFDARPRMISNLIVDQTPTNPSAVAAAAPREPSIIPHPTTDLAVSTPYNSLFAIVGQFFDHGLHNIANGGNGTVYVPLRADDPLIAGPDDLRGTSDDLPANMRFMVLTRGTNVAGPGIDGVLGTADDTAHEALNTDSSWVDLSQVYAAHPSHQVFLREYTKDAHQRPQATGRLLASADGSMATWRDVKTQAATKLGLQLVDTDVSDIPMLAADAYGNFIRGSHGLPQYVTANGLVEGNLAAPVAAPADVRRIGTAFLDEIVPSAVPTPGGPDADHVAGPQLESPSPVGSYDDELLDLHVIAGDGRANENIGLTAVHTIFEHEHNRLIADEQRTLDANPSVLARYEDTNCANGCAHDKTSLPATFTFGERMFQAARLVTEMEYEHLVFDEFAHTVQPAITPSPYTPIATNAAVTAEFAHSVSRFADSMLDQTIPRTNVDGSANDIDLLDGSLNPAAFADVTSVDLAAAGGDMGAAGAGAIASGLSAQLGNDVDEFFTDALRTTLSGQPLDLAAIDIAGARSEGVPTLNTMRKQIFAQTNNDDLRPYDSWVDFGTNLKHPESLINFVAAYGRHPTIRDAGPDGILGNRDDVTTVQAKRAAARAIVNPVAGDVSPPDAVDFMTSTGAWLNEASNVSITGVDDVDLSIGGLAERTDQLGGLLGTTFNYIFQLQMTELQASDRLDYLNRDASTSLRTALDGDSFAKLVMRNTTATNLQPDAFRTDDCRFTDLVSPATTGAHVGLFSVQDDPATQCNENTAIRRSRAGEITYRSVATTPPSNVPPTTVPPTTVPPTTVPPTTVPPTTTSPPPTAPPPGSPAAMPVGDLPGWQQIFADDFTKDAALGSFNTVYGSKWRSYIGPDTAGKIHPSKQSEYNTTKVVSVHGGVVDKYLHTEFDQNGYNGPGYYMMSAGLLPKIPGQLHGRYTVRLRADGVDGYKVAWLLWPDSGVWPRDGEIDFAETSLVDPLKAFIHRQDATVGSDQTACKTSPGTYLTNGWHTVTLEWSTTTKLYVDGVLECSTSDRVPNTPMHLVLQTESELFSARTAASGHLYLDWVAVYKPA